MKNKLFVISILLITILTTISSCKKGEDDPFFTLRSRTSRLVGEWKVSELDYNVKRTEDGITTDATYTYLNGDIKISYKDGTYFDYKLFDRYTFEKNGTYERRIEYPNGSYKLTEGNWSWLKKNKDLGLKNKEAILLTATMITESESDKTEIDIYSGNTNRLDDMLVFKRLSNDEIVIDYDYTHTDNNGYSYQRSGEAKYESN